MPVVSSFVIIIPMGNVQPSEFYLTLTRKIKESGNVMDIKLLDHLIAIPEGTSFSMVDEGISKSDYYNVL